MISKSEMSKVPLVYDHASDVPCSSGLIIWYLRYFYSHSYVTDMIDLEPPFPTAEQLEASAKPERKSTALWVWGDTYYETELLMREIVEQAKEEEFFAWGL